MEILIFFPFFIRLKEAVNENENEKPLELRFLMFMSLFCLLLYIGNCGTVQ